MPLNHSFAKKVAVGTLLLMAMVVLVWKASNGFSVTDALRSPGNVRTWTVNSEYFLCLDQQVKSVVPPFVPVWVSDSTPNGPEWYHTLKTVVAASNPIRPHPNGVVRLYLVVSGSNANGCHGVQVKAVSPYGAVRYGSGSLRSSVPLPVIQP